MKKAKNIVLIIFILMAKANIISGFYYPRLKPGVII